MPTLEQVALDPQTLWGAQGIAYGYGQTRRTIELTSGTAVWFLWFHAGQPAVPIRWVSVRDPLQQFRTQALLCTDLTTSPVQIVEWFIQRWQLGSSYRLMNQVRARTASRNPVFRLLLVGLALVLVNLYTLLRASLTERPAWARAWLSLRRIGALIAHAVESVFGIAPVFQRHTIPLLS